MIYISESKRNNGQWGQWSAPELFWHLPTLNPTKRDVERWRRRQIREREQPGYQAAATFRAQANSGAGSATSVNKPTGTANNDAVIHIAACFDDTSITTFTWASGYTEGARVFNNTVIAGTHSITAGWSWKVAASEPASWTITNANSRYQNLIALAYQGTDTVTPIDTHSSTTHNSQSGGYTATWATLPANVARDGSVAIAVLCGYDVDGTTPSGYTSRVNAVDGVHDASDIACNAGALTAPTASVATSIGANMTALFLIVLQPPASGGSVNTTRFLFAS